eukprot:525429_1
MELMFAADSDDEFFVDIYSPVASFDPDTVDELYGQDIPHVFLNPSKKRWICLRATVNFLGYVVITALLLYLLCLFAMFHPTVFDYIRHSLSGLTAQPTTAIESYTQNCVLTWNNLIYEWSIYIAVHAVMIMLTTFAVRNRALMWFNAILWQGIQNIYFGFDIFGMTEYQRCWFYFFIFEMLSTVLGIEIALLLLKYIFKIYPRFSDWIGSFQMIYIHCRCSPKWYLVSLSLVLLPLLMQLGTFSLCEHTLWLAPMHYLSVIRYLLLVCGCMGAFAQLYYWMYKKYACTCGIFYKLQMLDGYHYYHTRYISFTFVNLALSRKTL